MSATLRDALAAHFRSKPNVWLDGVSLEAIAGRYAWRSRVSDCRRELGMDIRNRQQRMKDSRGHTWACSWYMFVPAVEAPIVNQPHGLNAMAPSGGRLW